MYFRLPERQIKLVSMPQLDRSVVLVDDDDFLRSLIGSFLESKGFEVHSAANAQDAIKLIAKVDPDALVLDIDLGGQLTGVDIANRVNPEANGIALVFLTSLSDLRFANTNVETDFPKAAYLNKHLLSEPQTLLDALDSVLADRGAGDFRQDKLEDRPLGGLTKTQIRVLQLVAAGKTNQQISDIRGTTIEATEAVIARIWKALGISSSDTNNARVLAARKYLQFANFHDLDEH